jgi:hypothetical protein
LTADSVRSPFEPHKQQLSTTDSAWSPFAPPQR